MLKQQLEENRINNLQQRSMQTSLVDNNRSSSSDLLYDGKSSTKGTNEGYAILMIGTVIKILSGIGRILVWNRKIGPYMGRLFQNKEEKHFLIKITQILLTCIDSLTAVNIMFSRFNYYIIECNYPIKI